MRMIMLLQFPIEPFNTLVRHGSIGEKMHRILDAIKPESAYFTERDGHRGAILVVNLRMLPMWRSWLSHGSSPSMPMSNTASR